MPDTTWAELAARGAAWIEEFGRRLEYDVAHRNQMEAAQQQQQRFMEELSARMEERLQQVEDRVAQLEGSLLKVLGSLMPKVEELLAKNQNSDSSTAITNVPHTQNEDASSITAPRPDVSLAVNDLETERLSLSAPNDEECEARHSSSSTADAMFSKKRPPSLTDSEVDSQAPSHSHPKSLHEAAVRGDVAALQKMLAVGGQVDARDSRGNTALHLASSYGHVEAVDCLIANGALIDRCGEMARTPLLCAVAGGHMATVSRLIVAGANLEMVDADGASALAVAATEGHENLVEFLIEKGANVEHTDKNGETPLHRAVKGRHLAVVALLLRNGCSPRAKDKKGESPMCVAAKVGCGDALGKIWQVVAPNHEEAESCLSVAGSGEVIWLLVDVARNLVLGPAGEKALRLAANDGRLDVLESLIRAGVNPHTRNNFGGTALHHAAGNGHVQCVRALLETGVDPNSTNSQFQGSNSALHLAARGGYVDCVRELLQGGTERDLRNLSGKTALQLALENNQTQCAKLLQ